MNISPKPHERAALALAALITIASVLALLAAQMCGGVTWL